MKRDYLLFIEDIIDSIEKIEQFVGDMDFGEFLEDEKTSTAVIKKLEIIGEASKNIPENIRDTYNELPWSDMARMRDKTAHSYFGINYEIIWKVVKGRLPEIKSVIQKMLKNLRD